MDFADIALVAAGVLAFALVSARASNWGVTMPMVFVALGALADGTGVASLTVETEGVALIGELTLAVILFGDAVRIDLRALRTNLRLPARLLGIGLPLSVGLGLVMVAMLAPDLSLWEAALVAAILAPTDAALGQAVVEEPSVPLAVRQGLTVESGLNDGMVVPLVALFAALAVGEASSEAGFWAEFVLKQIGLGVAIGLAVGVGAGLMLKWAQDSDLVEGIFAQLAVLATGLFAFSIASVVESNGFIAVFVGGLAFGEAVGNERAEKLDEYTEDSGRLLATVAFFLFGNLFVLDAFGTATLAIVICVVLVLTVGRLVPVAIALLGSRRDWRTVAFVGWFGPRGLASILFGLLLIEDALPQADRLFAIIALTVLGSVVAHGVTASHAAMAYGRWYHSMSDDERAPMPESEDAEPQRPRWGDRPVDDSGRRTVTEP